jgi:hypothetical protein
MEDPICHNIPEGGCDRLLGALGDVVQEIEQAISELKGERRLTLYLNEERVKEDYDSILGPDQRTVINHLTKEVGGGISAWFAKIQAKISGTMGSESQKQFSESPLLMAVIVEAHYRRLHQLLRLPNGESRQEDTRLIKYVGESHVTENDQDVTAETTGLRDDLAQVVKEERDRQVDRRIRWKASDPSVFVWTTAGQPALASIGAWEMVTKAHYVHYWYRGLHRKNPLGILGSREDEKSGIVFITPLWIWMADPSIGWSDPSI